MDDLSTALGLANSAIQFAGAQVGASSDKKFIRQENEKSRDFQLQMWQMANEYNRPEAIVSRLQSAGLNPALMYKEGAGSLLADYASAPGHSAPNMGSAQNSNQRAIAMAQIAMQKQLQDSNLAVNDSIIEKNLAEASQASNLGEKYNLENYVSRETLKTQVDSAIETYQQLLKSGKIQDEKLLQEIEKKLQEAEKTKQELEKTKQEQENTFQSIEGTYQAVNETERTKEAVKTQQAQTENLRQHTATLRAQEENYRVDSSLKRSEIRVNNANIDYIRKMGVKTDAEANKILVDGYNAVLDGRLNRLLNSQSRRYGTGTMGAIIGSFLDTAGIKLDPSGKVSLRGASYYAKKLWNQLTPLQKQLGVEHLKNIRK